MASTVSGPNLVVALGPAVKDSKLVPGPAPIRHHVMEEETAARKDHQNKLQCASIRNAQFTEDILSGVSSVAVAGHAQEDSPSELGPVPNHRPNMAVVIVQL